MHELAKHGGQLGPPGKDGGLGGQPLGGPESAGGPVSEGRGDPQLPHQRENVVVLRGKNTTNVMKYELCNETHTIKNTSWSRD